MVKVLCLFTFQLMPSREEQLEFFTQTFDDEGEEDEKRTSAMKAGIKLHGQRRASMPSTSAAGDQPPDAGHGAVSLCRLNYGCALGIGCNVVK